MPGSPTYIRAVITLVALALLGVSATPAVANAGTGTRLVSLSSSGAKASGTSSEPSSSQNGRFVAFNSDAGNLVPGDSNGTIDCFVRDTVMGTTERVSVATGGGQSNGWCYGPAISDNGRFVAFESIATNLGGSTNGLEQVYLHDRFNDTTVLVSQNVAGTNGGNRRSGDPAISRDGRFVVFVSGSSDLVGGDTNNSYDIFLWDRLGGTTRVSVRTNGVQANGDSHDADISATGRFVVFDSVATNLVNRDGNRQSDCFIHETATGRTSIVSVNSRERLGNGPCRNATVSASGRWVAFNSQATNMARRDRSRNMDVFLRDRARGKTIQVSLGKRGRQAAGHSWDPSISNSGRYIAFTSTAGNIVAKGRNRKRDVFRRDLVTRTTKLVSRLPSGRSPAGHSDNPSISGNGRFVAFESEARNLQRQDRDTLEDIYLLGPLR